MESIRRNVVSRPICRKSYNCKQFRIIWEPSRLKKFGRAKPKQRNSICRTGRRGRTGGNNYMYVLRASAQLQEAARQCTKDHQHPKEKKAALQPHRHGSVAGIERAGKRGWHRWILVEGTQTNVKRARPHREFEIQT
ncbi:hypothetical protein PoB_002262900 [Plakobranchus ocellatus]|uniref:Uncharacterized protein n=1 Tax=Plakobranchus ocellatus TaxID=259542 RepID=A0AAV3ZP18_9GAST|nr:hypothetical protein PoB_002262900 [Plakobranchus ocellatus]